MIVVCPCCQKRYHHDSERDHAGSVARCSTCDERFPLAQSKPNYRLAEVGATPASPELPPGMGGPLLAAAAGADNECPVVAIDIPISTPVATVSQVAIDLPAGEAPELAPDPATLPAEEQLEAAPPSVAGTDLDVAQAGTDASTSPAAGSEPQVAHRSRSMWESLVALLPCGIGAGMAYHFAGPWGQDPITWAALGGAIGLLFGWACLLWITRGDS